MGPSRALWWTGRALRSMLSCTLAFILSSAELYTTARSSCERIVCPNSFGLVCMGSISASHQFLKSSGAAEEHLETKPPYAWRPGGAGHELFLSPLFPARQRWIWLAEQGGQEWVNAVFLAVRPRTKALQSRSHKPMGCTTAFMSRLSGNNLAI